MSCYATRRMVVADADAVQALHKNLFPVRYGADFFRAILEDPSYVSIVLVDESCSIPRVVGVATGFARQKSLDLCGWRRANTFYMATFGIHAQHRRRGLGRALLKDFQAEALRAFGGTDAFLLHVKVLNDAAVGFYLSAGFRVLCRKSSHYHIDKSNYDALKMGCPVTAVGNELFDARDSQVNTLWRAIKSCCSCNQDEEIIDGDAFAKDQ
jgi:ribosomal protein S18 acetylase RimI-like enzyme